MVTKFAGVVSAVLLSAFAGAASAAWTPERPIEFISTAGAGGGTDTHARTVQAIIVKYKLVKVPVVVINKPGGNGAEGFIYGASDPYDPYKVTFSINNAYLLPLVAKVGYQADSLAPVAIMAMDEFILWANGNSPYKTAKDLIEAAKKPGGLKMGGTQSKGIDQTLTSMIANATGAKFTYVPFKGGGDAAVQLSGNHIDANVNNPSESLGQWKAGLVRPLCLFGAERMALRTKVTADMAWSDIPLCSQEGIPISAYELPRLVWLPAKVPAEVLDFYRDLMSKVREKPEWKAYIERSSQSDRFLTGDAMRAVIKADTERASEVFKREGWAVQ